MKKRLLFIFFLLCMPLAFADGTHETNVEQYYPVETFDVFWIGTISLAIFTLIALYGVRFMNELAKKLLFIVLCLIVIASTLYFIGTTLYINSISITKGPVHWHADFEFWMCGEKIDIIDPKGLSNKVGTPVFHEHNDDRIHVEGVVLQEGHVSLASFLEVVGGTITPSSLALKTNEGTLSKTNGDLCNGVPSQVQVFVYSVENPKDHKEWFYTQRKELDYESVVLSPYIDVPPGDCIIVEFGPSKSKTDHMCSTYRVGKEKGELTER